VDSPTLDREQGVLLRHVGAARLVGEGLTVHRVDDAALDENEGVSLRHVGTGRFLRGSVGSQGEGTTLFLEQGEPVRDRCVALGLGSVHRSRQRNWSSRRLFTDEVEDFERLRGHGTGAEGRSREVGARSREG
jgi:hypothetical protein